jgi:hypothetical protein
MARAEATTDIDRPPEDVFAFVADAENNPAGARMSWTRRGSMRGRCDPADAVARHPDPWPEVDGRGRDRRVLVVGVTKRQARADTLRLRAVLEDRTEQEL